MKVYLDPGAAMPSKAHSGDAGYDLYSRDTVTIYAGESATFDTGVHVAIPPLYAGLLVSKSGLNVKRGITSTGLIDSGYTGSIIVKLYNHGAEPYTVNVGDKISQLVVVQIDPLNAIQVGRLDMLGDGERGDNGFGSTGR
ncbi:MAG TPA: dUTP diphosphatase [Candidatus Omnitrophota bacterium]|nr:dUTP diphosphatase [Candidatus Omnitrophota bacterium]